MPGLAQARDGLDPAEDLLDSLPFSLTDDVALVARGAFIDGARAPLMLVLRYFEPTLVPVQRIATGANNGARRFVRVRSAIIETPINLHEGDSPTAKNHS